MFWAQTAASSQSFNRGDVKLEATANKAKFHNDTQIIWWWILLAIVQQLQQQ